ncbi:TRAP transporter substrate-binding protein [Phreatobacter stygius]|uniref:TRAP transporter substrate-binding protein n=2 Tax=Phreatobacter stygius TaxID=1940610 RepID=A0A4D7B7Q1_9HYPH|nr:TRAP transporter substrate-binding protein [Phreatobacter stygius]QCI69284.1 TRAP transporter substrate-binding protein [Phreatobacter stygius]
MIAFGAAVLAAAAPSAVAREFRVADTQAADYPTVQALERMGQLVRERTQGRHSLRIFHSRQLGEEKETIEQTRIGAIDINRTNVAPLASFIPEANVLALPFLFRSVEHLHRVLDGPIGEEILARFEVHGLVGLTFYDSGARSIYNSVRPIRTVDDLKGLRIRVQQSEMMVEMMRALGAEPVALPYGQVNVGLSTGLIQGAENNWPSYVTTDHFRSARYLTLTEHTMSPEVLVVSKRVWEGLSAEDKAIFRDAARESSRSMREQWLKLEQTSRREAEVAGVNVVTLADRSGFERAVSGLVGRFAGEPGLAALVERIRQAQ